MFKKKYLSILFFMFLFCLIPTLVSADDIEKQTTTLDLITQNTEDNLSNKGWKWDSVTKTLTLKNANFETTEFNRCINLPEGNVTIEFEGNNTLKAQKGTVIYGNHNSNLTLKGKNGGILNLEIIEINDQGSAPSNNHLGGNAGSTLRYPYNLNVVSGTINSNGDFSIDNNFNMNGGNLNINTENKISTGSEVPGIYVDNQVTINGGNLNIKANGRCNYGNRIWKLFIY